MEINKTLIPDFIIGSFDPVSAAFKERMIFNFHTAVDHVRKLPYGRNTDKKDVRNVLTDKHGTCGTKHALLKQLAIENNFHDVKLVIGLFKMNGLNTPEVANTLKKNQVDYIPEAHCYLRFGAVILDCMKENSDPSDFINDVIEETEIEPHQITEYKVDYHKKFLKNWLLENPLLKLSLDELWEVREQCIKDLGN